VAPVVGADEVARMPPKAMPLGRPLRLAVALAAAVLPRQMDPQAAAVVVGVAAVAGGARPSTAIAPDRCPLARAS
jgi:hypothetical protein